MELSDWISLVGIIFAVISFIYTRFTRKKLEKQNRIINEYIIKKYQLEKENSQKASFASFATKSLSHGMDTLHIYNSGNTAARNVVVHLSDLRDNSVSCSKQDEIRPVVEVGQEIQIYFLCDEKSFPMVKVTWEDDFSTNNEKLLNINVF